MKQNQPIQLSLTAPSTLSITEAFVQSQLDKHLRLPSTVTSLKLVIPDSLDNTTLQAQVAAKVVGVEVAVIVNIHILKVAINTTAQSLYIHVDMPEIQAANRVVDLGFKLARKKIENAILTAITLHEKKLPFIEGTFPDYTIHLGEIEQLRNIFQQQFEGLGLFDLVEVNQITCSNHQIHVALTSAG